MKRLLVAFVQLLFQLLHLAEAPACDLSSTFGFTYNNKIAEAMRLFGSRLICSVVLNPS